MDYPSKLYKIYIFLSFQGVFSEKLTHLFKTTKFPYPQTPPISIVLPNHTTPKEALESIEYLNVSFMLDYNKLWQDLVASAKFRMFIYTYMKTSFTVYKTNNPVWREFHIRSSLPRESLLQGGKNPRVQSLRIPLFGVSCGLSNLGHFYGGKNIPLVAQALRTFPHTAEFRQQGYLRTVIVTAAVYRGFGSPLAGVPLTFRHWAGVRPYTSPYGLCIALCFW